MRLRFVTTLVMHSLVATAILRAQPDRISRPLNNAQRVILRGNVHARAVSRNDLGAVEPGFPMQGMTLHLAPSDAQRTALQTLLAEQQDPASSHYHQWLTPEQFADRFGASRADVSKISAWLESQGFLVDHAARSRNSIVFSGTAGQVSTAFQTQIHRFRPSRANDATHYANSSEPSLPAALDGIVSVIGGLDDFVAGSAPQPQFDLSNGAHALAPNDLSTIYDITPLYQAGIDGTGQKLVVVGQSRANLVDLQAFRTNFGLSPQVPTLILVPGFPDPGVSASYSETALDLEWSGAIARNASLIYVYSTSAFAAIAYAVDQNLAPVISASFGFGCEQDSSPGYLLLFQLLAQQANAQGITWVNASGDVGAAGCDYRSSPAAQNGASLPVPDGIPEITIVGGTLLDDSGGTYWNNTNDANGASAQSYIPEKAWNDSTAFHEILAGTGGSSSFFFKPTWQTGPGVPADAYRDAPDVALASASHNGYLIYYLGAQAGSFGTSAAAPVFAGMVTLLNQAVASNGGQAGLGSINPMLYGLAQKSPGVFHDVTAGDTFVPCAANSPNCTQGSFGFAAGPGYDRATGLGSPDFNKLVQQWTSQASTNAGKALISIAASKNPVYQQPPDAIGSLWQVTFTLTEEAGVGATVNTFLIDGVPHLDYFAHTSLPPFGSTTVGIGFTRINSSGNVTFTFSGVDAGGTTWTQAQTLTFVGLPPVPSIAGIANAASFQNSYAPGMQVAVFGTQLTDASPQGAASVPLLAYLDHFYASINGVFTPIYYVSSSQVNIQIPYETQPGPATLTVVSADGFKVATFNFTVTSSAPGVFADGNGFTVPFRSGARGQTLTLFITGEGQVSPSLPTGASPDPTTPVGALPRPRLPAKMTIGGVDAPIQFIGIPSGLVGVTQVNFQIPATAPLGDQPVVVTIGTVPSLPAKITVTP